MGRPQAPCSRCGQCSGAFAATCTLHFVSVLCGQCQKAMTCAFLPHLDIKFLEATSHALLSGEAYDIGGLYYLEIWWGGIPIVLHPYFKSFWHAICSIHLSCSFCRCWQVAKEFFLPMLMQQDVPRALDISMSLSC